MPEECRLVTVLIADVPDAALTEVELARASRDRALLDAARADLERIGDQVGLRRVAEAEASF